VSVGNVFYVEQNVIIEPNLQLIDNTCMTKFAARWCCYHFITRTMLSHIFCPSRYCRNG